MNAYELADVLESMADFDECEYQQSANMLRQQAQAIATLSDRIAQLEKELYFKNYYEELPDTPVGIIGKIGDSPIHDLVHRTTPQIKELSDEEILKMIAHRFHYTEYKLAIEFAKEILKKASEK